MIISESSIRVPEASFRYIQNVLRQAKGVFWQQPQKGPARQRKAIFQRMQILYIKRAYNTRLHTQIHALREKGHSVILLLEAPVEYGYNGPGQWNAAEICSRFEVYYALPPRFQNRNQGLLKRLIQKALSGLSPAGERFSRPEERLLFRQALHGIVSRNAIDIIISGNDAIEGEDFRTRLVIEQAAGKIPVVYDCQDFLTDCFDWDKEAQDLQRFVNEKTDGVIHTNPVGFDWIASQCKIRRGLVFPNYASRKYFSSGMPRLSSRDGQLHLVYCGGVQQTPEQYRHPFARDMLFIFREIADLGFPLHLHLGLYPDTPLHEYYMELKNHPGIIMHPYLPYEEAMKSLTRYDIGLFPLELGSLREDVERMGPEILMNSPFSRIDTSKQYEYTLAGLPVMTAPITWVSRWLEENGFGTCFNSVAHLGAILKSSRIKDMTETVQHDADTFSIENKVADLENFLLQVIADRRKG